MTSEFDEFSAIDLPDIEIGNPDAGPAYVVPPDAKQLAVKFGIIGSGQGGAKLASTHWDIGYRRVCCINTTAQDFLGLNIPRKNQFVMSTEGIGGAGKDPEVGARALQENREDVLNLMRHSFGEDIERIMICASLGGGSGSGSAPGLFDLASEYMRLIGKEPKVGMMVSLPKHSEGGRVQENAYNAVKKLSDKMAKQSISPLVIVDNEAIHRMFPRVSAKEFWNTTNRNIVGLFDIFNLLAAQNSAYATFDRADYCSVLDAGTIIVGATKLENYQKDTDIADGLRNNLKRTLLADCDITKATHVAAILCAPDSILSVLPQADIDLAFTTLERIMQGENRNLMVHQGVYEAKRMGLFLYTMVGGLKIPKERIAQMKARAGIK